MTKKNKIFFTFLFIFAVSVSAVFLLRQELVKIFFSPTQTNIEKGITLEDKNKSSKIEEKDIEILAENLEIPWEIVFLPDKSLLVSERVGNLIRIKPDSKQKISVSGVEHTGEGGLLGIALHPDFNDNSLLYLYMTTKNENGLINRVERYRFNLEENSLQKEETIIDNIPGARYHDGGRIAFGPDKLLYITTGDAGQAESAQDVNSLAGKILRLNPNGSIPEDNPFGNEVYSYGHRNPQGLAWSDDGKLWASEHGPSGLNSGFDEINLIEKGKNYGWPTIKGEETAENMITPVIQSGSDDTWAPAGLEILEDKIFFVGLRGSALYGAKINGSELENLKINFQNDWGRLRVVKKGPDGYLYLATSNRDGRGEVREGDDKIIKINPEILLP